MKSLRPNTVACGNRLYRLGGTSIRPSYPTEADLNPGRSLRSGRAADLAAAE